MKTFTRESLIRLVVLVLLAAFLFRVNLGGYDLWAPDEPRFAQVAREMMMTGDYLAPRVNGKPYTEKPPVYFWLAAAFGLRHGDVLEIDARLPSVVAGILTVVLTFLLALRLYGTQVAFWAGLIMITTQRFWWQSRFGQLDMVLTTCTTAALLAFWLWHTERKHRYLAGFYLSIAAGVLTKGPPAALFPVLMIAMFYWGRKPDRKALHLFSGLALVGVLVAIWLIPARMAISVEAATGAGDGIADNLFRQTIGRFFLGVAHANPPWFYLAKLPLDLLPWSLFLPWVLWWVWKRRKEDESIRLLLSWIVPAFVFFSICIGKRSIYLLPLYPAIMILTSRAMIDLMTGDHMQWRKRTAAVWGILLLPLAIAPLVLPYTEFATYGKPSLLLIAAVAGLCALHVGYLLWRTDARSFAGALAIHFAILATAVVVFALPEVNMYKSARGFCAPLRAMGDMGKDFALYSLGFSREEYIYYAKHPHTPLFCDLLDVPMDRDLSLMDRMRTQSAMLKRVRDSVEETAIHDIGDISADEVSALSQDLEEALTMGDEEAAYLAQYESVIQKNLGLLFSTMVQDLPAFVFVQEKDWRWVVALHPGAVHFPVLGTEGVGGREVLLIANDAGIAVLAGAGS